jgi:Cu(I)/Ag(I) efflux system membrane fusion protein
MSIESSARWPAWLAAILGLACGMAAIFAVPAERFFATAMVGDTSPASGERWACPMLDFVGTKPGKCPVCGMTLQRVTAGELSPAQAKRMGVQLTTVQAKSAVVTVHAYGAVRYDERTTQVVLARVAGRVVKRHGGALHPGLMVKVGEPLIDLYSPELFTLQAELAAAIRLHDQDLITALGERFQRLNLAHVAEAISQGQAPSDIVTISSPFAGRVLAAEGGEGRDMVAVGAEIRADEPLLRLVDPQAYMVVIHVPEPQAHLLREGQHVDLASDDRGELPDVRAEISWVAPEINPEIRAREVHLHLTDSAHRLLPGSLVNARIRAVLGAADASGQSLADDPEHPPRLPIIPASAVLSTGVRSIAWKLTATDPDGHQHFAIAPLALGQRLEDEHGNDAWVVRAGLAVGDQVATQGAFLIDSQAQLAGTPSLLFPLGAAGSGSTGSGPVDSGPAGAGSAGTGTGPAGAPAAHQH